MSDANLNEVTPARGRAGVLLVILLVGLVARLALWVWFDGRTPPISDEKDYSTLAVNLIEHGEYAFVHGSPTALRPPLYPLFVAGVYRVFGAENYQAVRLIQAFLSLATVVLVYRLGAAAYSERAGLWAAGLVCFYPSLLGTVNLLLTETLFTLELVALSLGLIRLQKGGSLKLAAAVGLLLGAGALTRSIFWLFPPVVGLYLLASIQATFGRRLLAVALLGLVFGATVAPWAIRNTRLEQTLVVIDTMGGRNFMMGNYEHTPLYRAWDAISVTDEKSWDSVLESRHSQYRDLTQGQRDKLAFAEGLRFVMANPGLTVQRDLIKLVNFWQLERELIAGVDRGYFGEFSKAAKLGLAALICGAYALAMLSAIFGALLFPPAWRPHGLLLLLLAYVTALHTLTFAHSRYHLPLMPLVLIYSAAALMRLGQIWGRRRRPAFWMAFALSAGLVASWLWEILVVDFGRYQHLLLSRF